MINKPFQHRYIKKKRSQNSQVLHQIPEIREIGEEMEIYKVTMETIQQAS